ncbi:MAG: hypothetical protein NTU53_06670 [Planctomycetota bacterium]|nr:hypothetical protein [Planctomycetota bacterium]
MTQFSVFVVAVAMALATHAKADWDLMSDTWVATDSLGRSLPTSDHVGPPRQNKTVGIFYFLWLGSHGTPLHDITQILAANPDNPQWGPPGAFHFWAEPLFGYYRSDDPFVIRKHLQMLTDAGVDVLFFDVTNAFTYDQVYLTVCKTMDEIRKTGQTTPQIAFLANTHSAKTVQKVYEQFYAKKLYPQLWFIWDGKPLLLTPPDDLSPEVKQFFTIRHSWAWSDPRGWFKDGHDKWPWLDHYPQKPGWHDSKDKPEQISVNVAQHPTSNIGRSFHNGKQPPPNQFTPEKGLCFDEQWRRAFQVDPQFVFITGWNEWVAQRFLGDGRQPFLGKPLPKGGTFFVDQYNHEFSRDIEPMKAGHADAYYYQLVANIRKFKGARPVPPATATKTIRIDADFSDWLDVAPEYRDTIADTAHRDHPGFGNLKYTDTTGRNDFTRLKVARDQEFIYFFAQTQSPLTPPTDQNWMLLFIDSDSNPATGSNGYDFLINHPAGTLEKWSNNQWTRIARITYRTKANQLELVIPRPLLNLAKDPLQFDFHWADNIQSLADPTTFLLHGDSAPNGRFNYRYKPGK